MSSTAASAQTVPAVPPSTAGSDDIIVTATRRSERLQDVPVSVVAFSQAKLDRQSLRSIDDLTRFSPGVTFTRNGLSGNYNDASNTIAIRGIDSTAGAATTGIYIDDTPIQSRRIGFGTQNAYPALFDLERVEVLRGPQGTLFGAGSEGGTVRFIAPSAPLNDTAIYARAEGAMTHRGGDSYELGGAIGTALITDTLGIRVSGSFRRDGGYVDRVDPVSGALIEKNSNYTETATARIALKWVPTPRLSIQPSVYWQTQYVNDTGAYWALNPALSDPGKGIFKNGNRQANVNRDPLWLAALRLEYDFGSVALISNTSYFQRRNRAIADYTQFDRAIYLGAPIAPPGATGTASFTDFQENAYQELRLQSNDRAARLSWTVGLFAAHLVENSTEFIVDPTLDAETGGIVCGGTCPGGLIYSQPEFKVVDRQVAGFAEANFKITPTLTLTAGVRVSDVRYTTSSNISGPFFGGAEVRRTSGQETPVTPRVGISYQAGRGALFYASAAKGFRVGGANAPVTALCDADLASLGIGADANGVRQPPRTYSSDTLWSYEGGIKFQSRDRRFTANGSVFLIDWTNIQQNVYLPTCGLQFTANLGQVRSIGGDLELSARPIDQLNLTATLAYTDSYYTRNSGGVGRPIVSAGDRLRGSPWSIVLSGEYAFTDDKRRQPYIRADYQFSSRLGKLNPTLNPANALSDVTLTNVPDVSNLNLRLGLRLDSIDVSLFAQNVTNDLPVLFTNRDVSYVDLRFARSVRPRTFGATVTVRR